MAIVPVFKKGNIALVINYRFISVLNDFSKLFALNNKVSCYLRFELNPCQHFSKCKSTTTTLVTYLDFITPVVGCQDQIYAIYFDLSSEFGLDPHAALFHEFSGFGFSGGYINWFHIYLTNKLSHFHVSGILLFPFEVLLGVPQRSVLGPLLFSVFINYLCDVINHCRYLIFVHDAKNYCAIKS